MDTSHIHITKPKIEELEKMGVFSWDIWEKEISTFEYNYDEEEKCYFLEGEVEVEVGGQKFEIKPGDFVVFPKGLSCTWHVKKPVKKHYKFG